MTMMCNVHSLADAYNYYVRESFLVRVFVFVTCDDILPGPDDASSGYLMFARELVDMCPAITFHF